MDIRNVIKDYSLIKTKPTVRPKNSQTGKIKTFEGKN